MECIRGVLESPLKNEVNLFFLAKFIIGKDFEWIDWVKVVWESPLKNWGETVLGQSLLFRLQPVDEKLFFLAKFIIGNDFEWIDWVKVVLESPLTN